MSQSTDYVSEKCAHCHLFIGDSGNSEDEIAEGLAEYIHHSRGDDADEAIELSHDAAPSGQRRPLSWWKANGPAAMVARFGNEEPDPVGLALIAAGSASDGPVAT